VIQDKPLPSNINDLAGLLGIGSERLNYLICKRHLLYQRGQKVKRDGRIREFYKPHPELKKIQKKIHYKILKKLPVHQYIHSYRKGRDHVTNARPHVANPYMIKLDIKDFFPSITPTMVRTTLLKLGFPRPVSRMLGLLTTYREQLPQGPPTSPGIANLVLFPLARRFERLCFAHGVECTIYGDDITVSSGLHRVLKLKNLLMRIIVEEGFEIHPQKIQVLKPRDKKKVTGVVVNKMPNIDKEYYHLLRAQIHNCRVKGPATQFPGDQRKARESLFGKINHVKKLNPLRGKILLNEFDQIKWSL
jgi:hypothetical protein